MTRLAFAILPTAGLMLVLLVAAGCKKPEAPVVVEPKTAKVTRGDINLEIEATGSVESNLDVDIKCKASGTITTLPYDVSDCVTACTGEANQDKALLVALDPVDEQHRFEQSQAAVDADTARLDQAQAALKVAQANLDCSRLETAAALTAAKAKATMAHKTHDRTKQLYERKVAAEDELDNTLTQAALADAEVQSAQARLDGLKSMELALEQRASDVKLARASLRNSSIALADAQQRLTDTRIYSPIDGVVTRRDVQVGQIVARGIVTVGGGTSLMTVSDLSRMFVKANVDESDIGALKESGRVGQQVIFSVDAYPGRQFRGRVHRITPRGNTESNVITYTVKIEILGPDKQLLMPKMTVNVKILANRRKKALLLPNNAINYEDDKTCVELLRKGKKEKRFVKLGLNDGLQAEVLSGLAEGDEVALSKPQTKWSKEDETK